MKKAALLLVLFAAFAVADTLPPSVIKLKGATDGTQIGNVGDALKVTGTFSPAGSTVADQGAPAPAASAWPVYLPSPIPNQHVSVDNFPSPTPTQTISGSVSVSNFPSPVPTQSVSVVNFPAPTATQLVSGSVSVSNFPSPTPTQTVVIAGPSPLPVTGSLTLSGAVNQGAPGPTASPWPVAVQNFPATQPVSIAAPVAVTGTFFQATQPVSGTFFQATQPVSGSMGRTWSLLNTTDSVNVGNFPATQSVSGSVTANIGTTGGLALNSTLGSPFQAGGSIGNTAFGISGTLPAYAATPTFNLGTLNGAATAALQSTGNTSLASILTALGSPFQAGASIGNTAFIANAGTNLNTSALALESGGHLASIDTKTPALGQALSSASVPVVLTASQLTTLTPPTTVTANIGTTGGLALNSTLGSPFQAGGSIGNTAFGISGTLPAYAVTPTFNLGTLNGAATAANQATAQASLSSIDSKLTSPLTTNSTLQAGTAIVGKVGIDQTTPGTTNGVVVNSSALPTGASNAANQATANTSLASIVTNTTGLATATNQTTSNTNTGTTASNTTSMLANQTNGTQKTQVTAIPADGAPATQNITSQDLATTTTIGAYGQSIMTGTPSTNSAATFSLATLESVEIQVNGTWSGSLASEVSMDGGTTWYTRGIKLSGVSQPSSTFTQSFEGQMNVSGMTNVRLRATTGIGGTAVVRMASTLNAGAVVVSSSPLAMLGRGVVTTFTQNYSTPLATGAFTTIITSTTAYINEVDIFDTSGGDYYLAYAATCGALSNATNAIIVSAGGGGKDFQIPYGQCVGFEAKTASITSGSVNMTFYK